MATADTFGPSGALHDSSNLFVEPSGPSKPIIEKQYHPANRDGEAHKILPKEDEGDFAANADPMDVDGSSTEDFSTTEAEDAKEREKLLNSGAERVYQNIDKIKFVPRPFAQIIDKAAPLLSRLYDCAGTGKIDDNLRTQLDDVNAELAKNLASIKQPRERWQINYTTLHSSLTTLIQEKYQFDHSAIGTKGRLDHAIKAAQALLSVRGPLSGIGLTWRVLISPEEADKYAPVIEEALKSTDSNFKDIRELTRKYVQVGDHRPTNSQRNILKDSGEPIVDLIQSLEKNDQQGAEEAADQIEEINNNLQELNKVLSVRPNDQCWPLKKLVEGFQATGDKATYLQKWKIALAQHLLQAGLVDSANKLVPQISLDSYGSQEEAFTFEPGLFSRSLGPLDVRSSSSTKHDERDVSAVPKATNENLLSASANGMTMPKLEEISCPQIGENGKTEFGKIVYARPMGRGLCRVFVNSGSEKYPLYHVMMSSDFGCGMTEELLQEYGDREEMKAKLLSIKGKDIKSMRHIVRGSRTANREPPTYILCTFKDGSSGWITRSEAIRLLGKRQIDGKEGHIFRLDKNRVICEMTLKKCREYRLNPSTGQPMSTCSASEQEEWEWFFACRSTDSLTLDRKRVADGHLEHVEVEELTPPSFVGFE